MNVSPLPVECWYLTGPTASGKSAVGVELAKQLDAEIVSLDSMAIYRGMEIGTAKPTAAERQRVPHHLIDLREPAEEFSVAQYLAAAHECVAGIRSRGRQAVFVGGTPLYLKTLLRGLFPGPPADRELRARLSAEAERTGSDALHARLAVVDREAAARISPSDVRRLVRALEVYELTGRPISAWQQQFDRARPAEACRVFCLSWPVAELNRRIDERVDAMFAAGWVEEVRRLRAAPGGLGMTALQAVGYREIAEALDGQLELPAAIEQIKLRTRQFAKRQRTWFRSLSECRMVAMHVSRTPRAVAAAIAAEGLATAPADRPLATAREDDANSA
ncbi:MAG: tRNA (adenosine(37)-N6)-dimethylallyltransferase MiaA [Pirellulales bacterium]|nr:tRNA (adenosine(37)-N6)-dimethylallyltransferase MiaA [Pirellulales bacterium]